MSSVAVIPVRSARQRRQFLALPWSIYRGDPHWIPPLRGNQRELVGYSRHPFYRDAQSQTFLALDGARPVGRVAAVLNHAHNRCHHERRGFFGFFESVDDASVARGLLDAARGWLAERGITSVRGPVNPSMNYECGALVDGFHESPCFMMTYNPPYYDRLLQSSGLRKAQDLYAFWGDIKLLKSLDEKVLFVTEEAIRRFRLRVRRIDTRRFRAEVAMFLQIYNHSLAGTWGFTPLSAAEIDHISGALRHLIVPELTAVAEADGRPVAVVIGLLDYNPRIKRIDGRLFPTGFLRLVWNRRAIRRIRLISANVLPEYQKWGVGLVVLRRLVPEAFRWGIQDAEFSWVLESNDLSYKSLKRAGTRISKTYRIYDDAGAADAPPGAAEARIVRSAIGD